MPYFRKESDGQIVYRKHEFNAESLNGEIIKIENYTDCLLLVHIATKKFTWDVTPLETIGPEEGLEKLNSLGTRDAAKKGQPFYALIHSSHLHDYLASDKDFEFKEKSLESDKNTEEKKIIEKEPVELVKKREPVDQELNNEPREGLIYKPKLEREVRGEKPIKILR